MNPADAVGIMEGAYFVGRAELLAWLNDLLELSYTKVEQCANGAAHCQVFDALFPGKVPLHKVNFHAKLEYEFVSNYKVLQKVFDELEIRKHIEVDRLIKAKYQDNLEFLQWVKCCFDRFDTGEPYDAKAKREKAVEAYRMSRTGSSGANIRGRAPPSSGPTKPAARKARQAPMKENRATNKVTASPSKILEPSCPPPLPRNVVHRAEYDRVVQELNVLRDDSDAVEQERDFYFGKLRDIEIECQLSRDQTLPVIQAIQKILYSTPNGDEVPSSERQDPIENPDKPLELEEDFALDRENAGVGIQVELTPRRALPAVPTEEPRTFDIAAPKGLSQDTFKNSSEDLLNVPGFDASSIPNILDGDLEETLKLDEKSLEMFRNIDIRV